MQPLSFANSGIQVGDRAPDFELLDSGGQPYRLYMLATGRPILMFLYPDQGHPAAAATLGALAEPGGAEVLALGGDGVAANAALAAARKLRFRLLSDPGGRVATAYGLAALAAAPGSDGTVLVLLGRDLRVVGVWRAGEVAEARAAAAAAAATVAPLTNPPGVAPVLLIPNVFEPAFCRHLIEVFETQGNEESGIFRTEGGRSTKTLAPEIKQRRDHHITTQPLLGQISTLLQRRVLPEIHRAFCFEVSNAEEFKIVRYDAEVGGYFRLHRDNLNPQNAHRRLAMTLNLNTGDYQGGELLFPEFGPHRYRPPSGGAVVFSCSLLHEATDVTRGRRYVLLAFLHGEKQEQQRQQRRRKKLES
jgi:peroxiredoxin/predicted 2-oxoglutarate/Fe(II)-dependent dioxygenase YbiX